jgi:hypothetical protein
MAESKSILWMSSIAAALFAGLLALHPGPAKAAEADVTGDKSLVAPQAQSGDQSANEDHSPKSPIRVSTIDYQDAGEAAGTLKLAGTAVPGTPLYLYFDNEPLAKVEADSAGNWSLEHELKLDDAQHTLRAEQYDPITLMLAGRAMITIARGGPTSPGGGPSKTSTP